MANFLSVRQQSLRLCEPLVNEDFGVQTMPQVSPPKWHLAHTTWFFETFLLKAFVKNYQVFNPTFEFLFNSYYNGVGEPFLRTARGTLSRPTVTQVYEYREYADAAMQVLLSDNRVDVQQRIEVGLQHEQQHQELLLTDIKHILGSNPLRPVYRHLPITDLTPPSTCTFMSFDGGLCTVGHTSEGFGFDNEFPRHQVVVAPFQLANRLTTNGEYLQFIEAGGYQNFSYWLSDGWTWVQEENIAQPLYWRCDEGKWFEYQLGGEAALHLNLPVCHLSHYEADAFARWSRARLPTEFEWQVAAEEVAIEGNFVERETFQPQVGATGISQLFGDCWEWTSSAYTPFPGYQPLEGALGEYNGKFMNNQMVLKGGSCASPQNHLRASYRNFFPSVERWQFTGVRLARNA